MNDAAAGCSSGFCVMWFLRRGSGGGEVCARRWEEDETKHVLGVELQLRYLIATARSLISWCAMVEDYGLLTELWKIVRLSIE